MRTRLRRDWPLLVLIVPGLLYFIVFHYVPLLGNVIAFQRYQPYLDFFHQQWTGFANFREMAEDPMFWRAARNTVVISTLQLLLYFPAPIILALILNSLLSTKVKRAIQNIIYVPHFISWVIIAVFFQQLLGGTGPIEKLWLQIQESGVCGDCGPLGITTSPNLFALLITSETIWRDAGWGVIIYTAALVSIDQSLYEAAAADGAGRWRRLWSITLPGITGVTILLLILRLGVILSVGFEPVLLQQNAVGAPAGMVIDTYVYLNGINAGQWGVSATAGLMKGVIGTLLVVFANKIAHRFDQPGLYR